MCIDRFDLCNVNSLSQTEWRKSARVAGLRKPCANCDTVNLYWGETAGMSGLSARECVPCRGGVPPMKGQEIQDLLSQLSAWEVVGEHHLRKEYKFKDF